MNDHSHKDCFSCQLPNCNLLPCYLPAFERDASSEPMAPGSILTYLILLKQLLLLAITILLLCYLLPSISITCVLPCN